MSSPLANIGIFGPATPETVRVPTALPETSGGKGATKSPNQDSPFGPDYILQTGAKPQPPPVQAPVPKSEEAAPRVQKQSVAGVVPFTASSGPASDLAALPPLEPLGTEALTELSLNKLMQPSNKPGML